MRSDLATRLILTAVAEFIAPFVFGIAVATTVGSGLINPAAISVEVVIAAVFTAILWNLLTWWLAIPSSSSHALIGGVIGAGILSKGFGVIESAGLLKVLLSLFLSPLVGLAAGFLLMKLMLIVFQNASPRINSLFRRLQILTSAALAMAHGSNDSQKTIGIITMGLVAGHVQASFYIPLWVIALSATAISLGAGLGGWRLIRTLGGRIYKIRPVHALTSQLASAIVILGAALLGGPVSTTQVVSTTIMGAGAAERISKVRWQIGYELMAAWFITIPVNALVAALMFLPLQRWL